jgi:hypothetical protein
MATEPSLDATGALAIKPPRENIFARPRPANDPGERRGPAGIFAPAAACVPSDAATASAASNGTARHRLIGWPTRAIAIAGAVAAIAALTARPTPDGASAPSRPVSKQSTTFRTSPRQAVPRRKPSRARPAAKRAHRAHRSAAPKRAANRRLASRMSSPAPVVHAAPAIPEARLRRVPLPPRRGTGSLPKRVPAGAPPEFM